MRLFKKILIGLAVVLVLIQFVPRSINKSREILSADITKIYSVPDDVLSIFKNACYDCHSNHTRYPWYSHIQPFRLFLDKHIKDGKEELNFSEYGLYSVRRQRNKLKAIREALEDGTMPLQSYRLMHPKARLTKKQKDTIVRWINEISSLSIKTNINDFITMKPQILNRVHYSKKRL